MKLTAANPVPYCSTLEIIACVGEIEGMYEQQFNCQN